MHPAIVAFVQAALETTDLRIYQARVWSKYGDHTNYNQPLHLDANHSLLAVRQGPGWGHLECFLYLHDVPADGGAPCAVPAGAAGRNGLGIGQADSLAQRALVACGGVQKPNQVSTPPCTALPSQTNTLRRRRLRVIEPLTAANQPI